MNDYNAILQELIDLLRTINERIDVLEQKNRERELEENITAAVVLCIFLVVVTLLVIGV